jgi:hypothetical protein
LKIINWRERRKAEELEKLISQRQNDQEFSQAAGEDTSSSLLQMARVIQSALAPDPADEKFSALSPSRLISRLQVPHKSASRPAFLWPTFSLRTAVSSGIVAFVVLLSALSFGTVYASRDALPGDQLYAAKLGFEDIRLIFSISPQRDLSLLRQFSDRRIDEVQNLLSQQRENDLEQAILGYTEIQTEMIDLSQEQDEVEGQESLEDIQNQWTHHLEILEAAQQSVNPSAVGLLNTAIEHSKHSREVLILLQEGASPSEAAPGQAEESNNSEPDQNDRPRDSEEAETPENSQGKPPKRSGTPGPPENNDHPNPPGKPEKTKKPKKK